MFSIGIEHSAPKATVGEPSRFGMTRCSISQVGGGRNIASGGPASRVALVAPVVPQRDFRSRPNRAERTGSGIHVIGSMSGSIGRTPAGGPGSAGSGVASPPPFPSIAPQTISAKSPPPISVSGAGGRLPMVDDSAEGTGIVSNSDEPMVVTVSCPPAPI
jgi:hypothetical protein